jgi:U3 small nucleolar RNA-associated protein 18
MAYSKWKPNAIKLIHTPTFNVFANWPNFKTNLKFITSSAFSKNNSKYLAVGNDSGNLAIYNLLRYN